MSIVARHGRPDLFITMTANPDWPEIESNLFVNQKAVDRPDLVVRVFKLKLDQFIKEVKQKDIFGKLKAMTYSIEFQKRGLPHAHILLFLENNSKPVTAEDFERSELPNDPELYQLVLKHMIHRCSPEFCQKNGPCSKKFPKPFNENTRIQEHNEVIYKRRDNSHLGRINNSVVVPYNAYLLQRFHCHINVEIVNSLNSIKYLFKYVNKSSDRLNVVVDDEVKRHLNGRYVGTTEAVWRIMAFPLTYKYSIYLLNLIQDFQMLYAFIYI